jgi:hypothetical protein
MLEEVDFMAARKFLKYSGSGVGVSRLRGTPSSSSTIWWHDHPADLIDKDRQHKALGSEIKPVTGFIGQACNKLWNRYRPR